MYVMLTGQLSGDAKVRRQQYRLYRSKCILTSGPVPHETKDSAIDQLPAGLVQIGRTAL